MSRTIAVGDGRAARAVDWAAPFEALAVGDAFVTRGRTVTEADVVAFAGLTGDWHPQHADARWAAGSVFGERIAHGMLVVSLAVGLVPFDPERVVALRRVADVVFKRPVRLGETVRVRGWVRELTPLPGDAGGAGGRAPASGGSRAPAVAGLVTWAWGVEDGEGRTCCRARVEVLWRGDAAASDPYAPAADGFVPIPF